MFDNAITHLGLGEIIWKASGGSSFYCMLSTDTNQPDQTNDLHRGDFTECTTQNGYTANGAGPMTLVDASTPSSHYITFDANDIAWSTFSYVDVRFAIPYVNAGTYPLWSYHDFGKTTGGGGTFTVVWHATNGIARILVTTGA